MSDRPKTWTVGFEELEWQPVSPGAREKVVDAEDRRLRLLELTEEFEEPDWCRNAHWGIVLEGEMDLELPSHRTHAEAGDGLVLPSDDAHRHRVHIDPGGRALLFLIEPA